MVGVDQLEGEVYSWDEIGVIELRSLGVQQLEGQSADPLCGAVHTKGDTS